MATPERTLVLIKPGGVQRGLIGAIIQRFENKGLKLMAIKQVWSSEQQFRQHYSDLASQPYLPELVKYMSSGPVVSIVWEGINAVKVVRDIIGAGTGSARGPAPGTIRGDYCFGSVMHGTVIHASDSADEARREIDLWFSEKEIECSSTNGCVCDAKLA